MLLASVVGVSEKLRRTPGRLAKHDALAQFLKELPADELAIGAAYLVGAPRANRIGAAHALLNEVSAAPAPFATLTLSDVNRAFHELAGSSGRGATGRRRQVLSELFSRATEAEQDFLRRLVLNELRQGALESLMLDAIASAAHLPSAEIRRAAMYANDVGEVARAALAGGVAALARFDLQVFVPVMPMLAQPAESVDHALQVLGRAALEWKIDGARIQVHKGPDRIAIYTRSLNDVTAALPEVVAAVQALSAEELILDGEAIVLDDDGRPQPFQVSMRRLGRRAPADELLLKLPVSCFFFDILRSNGTSLVTAAAHERARVLTDIVPSQLRTPRLVTGDVEEAQAFLAVALAQGHEGIMAKNLDAPYEAGSRGAHWLKIKQARTLDLVVLAAEWGSGRRAGWLSNLHLGARDPATGGFVMLGKTFKGLTDETLAWQTAALLARETGRDGATVHVRPELVVEIAFNELQASPRYPGGLALRFARVKGYRPDKTPADADTIATVRSVYAATTGKPAPAAGGPLSRDT